jgi:hypothetical protein
MTTLSAVTMSVLPAVEASGERMAVLTTLVGLLELKHLQLEGESGTGSLEADMKLIEVTCKPTL